jgi:DNA polymerase III subunit gamma/tau
VVEPASPRVVEPVETTAGRMVEPASPRVVEPVETTAPGAGDLDRLDQPRAGDLDRLYQPRAGDLDRLDQPRVDRLDEPGATGLGLVDVRRLWPDLLDAVKLKRRYTWILLSQNAQVAAVDDKTMTIALVNAGARNSFTSGGSEEILRQAAIDVIGHDWRIEAIVDPSAQPGTEPRVTVTRPAVPQEQPQEQTQEQTQSARPPEPAPEQPAKRPVDPAAVAHARGAIQDTRPAGDPRERRAPDASDEHADRNDPDADDQGLAGAQLLERELGASIIEEIKHD